jgi:hypothetical protein
VLLLLAALNHREHFVFANDQVIFAIDPHFLSRVLPEQDGVALFHIEGNALAVFVGLASAYADDLPLLRLLLGRVRDDDAADFLFFFLDALHEDAVVERS